MTLKPAEVQTLMGAFDNDGSGSVDYEEFAKVLTGGDKCIQSRIEHAGPRRYSYKQRRIEEKRRKKALKAAKKKRAVDAKAKAAQIALQMDPREVRRLREELKRKEDQINSLTKEVEDVNQYPAVMYKPTAGATKI